MRSGSWALAMALVGSACGAQISDGLGANYSALDAQPGDLVDAVDAAPNPLCTSRTLFLNFDGQRLLRATTSDATLNRASWMATPVGIAPAFLAGNADRATVIQSIVEGVRAQLARFPINVVTIRPAEGEYVMVVLGGTSLTIGSRFTDAVNTLDCGDLQPNDVAWVTENLTSIQHGVNLVIGAVGFGLGLTASTDPLDCMCGWGNACRSVDTAACTLGSPIARDPAAKQLCPTAAATQDEVATLHDAFCR